MQVQPRKGGVRGVPIYLLKMKLNTKKKKRKKERPIRNTIQYPHTSTRKLHESIIFKTETYPNPQRKKINPHFNIVMENYSTIIFLLSILLFCIKETYIYTHTLIFKNTIFKKSSNRLCPERIKTQHETDPRDLKSTLH